MFPNVKCLTFGSSCKFKTDFSFVDEEEMHEEINVAQRVFSNVSRLTFGMVSPVMNQTSSSMYVF
jgi:hypothetical protein